MIKIGEHGEVLVSYLIGDYVVLGEISCEPDIALRRGYVNVFNGKVYIEDCLCANYENVADTIVKIVKIEKMELDN